MNLISHRGVTSRAVENSRLAFEDAVAAGFQSIETDLRATADGVIVLAHDDDYSHLAPGAGLISESTYERLTSIRLLDGQSIVRFDEFVDEFSGQTWILDIKPETAKPVIDVLASRMQDDKFRNVILTRARFLCWSRRDERYCGQRLGPVAFMPQIRECYRAGIACVLRVPALGNITAGRTYGLIHNVMGIQLFRPRIVKQFHRRGATVLAYLPASQAEIDAALVAGVDEMLLDIPLPTSSPAS